MIVKYQHRFGGYETLRGVESILPADVRDGMPRFWLNGPAFGIMLILASDILSVEVQK